ncbi:hypothetical protein ACIA8R_03660 [Nonomuraea sp. NPDC051191]|uniref:hypothetical protein n=1 Tax=Nonomuraea sp. NPDC051191 TaxID=3364372 RepID=UPI0037A8320D
MSTPGPVERIAASPAMIIADVSAVVALITADGVRTWVQKNLFIVLWMAIGLITALILLVRKLAIIAKQFRVDATSPQTDKTNIEHRLHSKIATLQEEKRELERRLHPTNGMSNSSPKYFKHSPSQSATP